jgi:hypothetical protein
MAESPNYDTVYEITPKLAEERIDSYLRHEAGKPQVSYCITDYPSHVVRYLRTRYSEAGWDVRVTLCQGQKYMRFIANE